MSWSPSIVVAVLDAKVPTILLTAMSKVSVAERIDHSSKAETGNSNRLVYVTVKEICFLGESQRHLLPVPCLTLSVQVSASRSEASSPNGTEAWLLATGST